MYDSEDAVMIYDSEDTVMIKFFIQSEESYNYPIFFNQITFQSLLAKCHLSM